jgi:hypothetical protein
MWSLNGLDINKQRFTSNTLWAEKVTLDFKMTKLISHENVYLTFLSTYSQLYLTGKSNLKV